MKLTNLALTFIAVGAISAGFFILGICFGIAYIGFEVVQNLAGR